MRHSNNLPELKSKAEWKILTNDWKNDWWYDRRENVKRMAWCILTEEVANRLGKWLSNFELIIEPFAGTGYIAEHLRRAGGLTRKQYRAYDGCRSHWKESTRPNYGFTKSGCFNLNYKAADVVVMTWPNYNENLAYRVVRKMVPGQYLIYNGEGNYGCTGDDKYHEYLETHFDKMEAFCDDLNEHHVKYLSIHDHWYVYRKK